MPYAPPNPNLAPGMVQLPANQNPILLAQVPGAAPAAPTVDGNLGAGRMMDGNPVSAPNLPPLPASGTNYPTQNHGITMGGTPMEGTAGSSAMYAPGTPGSGSGSGTATGSGGGPAYNGPISPVDVATPVPFGNGFQPFVDNAYAGFQRQLDPQFQDQERAFRQRMVNQGLTEGSQAYDNAWNGFSRSRNDAYDQAHRSAFDAGQQAQNQAFGQNLAESNLANELQRAQWGYDSSMAGINAGVTNNTNNNALQRELGLTGLGMQNDQFNTRFQGEQGQQDFQNMLALMGFDLGAGQYNNGLLNSDSSRGNPLLGLIPGVNPSQIDVMGPYGLQGQQQAAANANNTAQQNGTMGAIGSIAGAIAVF